MKAAKANEKRFGLDSVKRGKVIKPARVVLYGTEGVGKSTVGADAPSPIFIGAEDGTAQLDVARFPEPETWADVLESIETLAAEEHDFKTLVIDTADWLEPLCAEHVITAKRGEDLSYGRDVAYQVDEWRRMLSRLDKLRDAKGMAILVLAHSHVKTFNNPEGDDYDRFSMKLAPKISALLREWPDAVLFANYETLTVKEKGSRTKGVRGTARFIHTERTAAFDAKNRFSLRPRIPLSWADFAAGCDNNPERTAEIVERIGALIGEAASVIAEQATAGLERAGNDTAKLSQLENWLTAKKRDEK